MSKKKKVTVRDEHGRFLKGVSGNPAGRSAGTRNKITEFRENTELALRDYLSSEDNQRKALSAIDRCFQIATTADDKEAMQAMKILFDKILPNARSGAEEEGGRQRPMAIIITNQTSDIASSPVSVIDAETGEVIE